MGLSQISSSSGEEGRQLSIVEASVDELQGLLSSGNISCVELVSLYLRRISTYDCRGVSLNSIPIINPHVFDEAAASDDRRAAGLPSRPLEGIPFTVKDSYKVKGMTVASGSPAFQNLVSNEDAFTVQKLREAGAVLIGKTNMPPMAAGGMQRGVYGRAESPYNLDYLAAAFASGSSNGSAVSTAASFAAFGMGEETVSSGRSPASNNGLIAYTPSRGCISIRGNWPLYPTCDVIVPHTRTMKDMASVLDVITVKDDITEGDFWRHQSFVKLPEPWPGLHKSFHDVIKSSSLTGLRIAAPQMYTGGQQPAQSVLVTTSPAVISLWERAKSDLESCGAIIVPTADFPLVTNYENPNSNSPTQAPGIPTLPEDWNAVERGILIAYAWEEFLRLNADPNLPSLSSVESSRIFPSVPADDVQIRYSEPRNAIHWSKIVDYVRNTEVSSSTRSMYSIPNLASAVHALESLRERKLEAWLSKNNFDCVVFPANGDVGRADADINDASSRHAWQNGVKYSNGNRALRHVGVPTVSVPMGLLGDGIGMPVNLTFAGRGWDDTKLLGWAAEYERVSGARRAPGLTPELDSDMISTKKYGEDGTMTRLERPQLEVTTCREADGSSRQLQNGGSGMRRVELQGFVTTSVPELGRTSPANAEAILRPHLQVSIDAVPIPESAITFSPLTTAAEPNPVMKWAFTCSMDVAAPPQRDQRSRTEAKVPRDCTMVVVLAKNATQNDVKTVGGVSGWLGLL